MNLQLIEPTDRGGSIGTYFIAQALRNAGHAVEHTHRTRKGFDAELFSVHHVSQFRAVAKMKQWAPLRILGGHAFYCNPRPLIPFADYICVGEWDTGMDIDAIVSGNHPNVIDCKKWEIGAPLPSARIEKPLPPLIPYLNFENTGAQAWYVEIARGCPFSCAYCELGWSVPFRPYTFEQIKAAIDQIDFAKCRKVNIFAPDESSCKFRNEIKDYVLQKGGYLSSYASMRADTFEANVTNSGVKTNVLIRMGVDGLTEETRARVGKGYLTNDRVIRFFRQLLDAGHVSFKLFMMIGYPWEKTSDFAEFDKMMGHVFRLPLRTNVHLRVKWTPLIPQPSTPLGKEKAHYDRKLVQKIHVWHALHKRPQRIPGFYVECDGLQEEKTHSEQCSLTTGDENYFIGKV